VAATEQARTPLDKLLSLFAEVKGGEGVTAVLMFVNVFLLLTSYYVLKTVREGLIIGGGGMLGLDGDELKIYASAGMAFLLLGVIPAYGMLASKVSRIRLLNYCVLGVVVSLGVFFVLGRAGVPLGLAFFLWLGIVSVFLIAQFWSYANDIYTEGQGKRLFAIIAIGGSLGAWFGPKLAAMGRDYTYTLMLISAGVLLVCQLLYNVVNAREARRVASRKAAGHGDGQEQAPLSKEGGFQLVFQKKYLLLIAVMMLLANLVNTTGEFILSNAAKLHAIEQVPDTAHAEIADADARQTAIKGDRIKVITGFYGTFFQWVNGIAVLIQALLVSRIFKYLGVRTALFFLPVIAFGVYGLIGAVGGLALIRTAKIAENATDYSLQNTVRQALFLPTTREEKYKAKAAIDTFFVRIGDALAAGTVFVGIHFLAFDARSFAFVNVGLILLWLLVCVGIAKEHRELVPDDAQAA
jgi:AAA family ATP:ADP antiporter